MVTFETPDPTTPASAFTATIPPGGGAGGAVKFPFWSICPGFPPKGATTDHAIPAREDANVCLPPARTAVAAGLTVTGWVLTVTVTVALFEVSACEVAVTITCPGVVGAVKGLPWKLPPPMAVQFTSVFVVL